jgi:signal transduction histidine kinase
MSSPNPAWSLFLAAIVSVTILVVAFAAALVIAQRRRLALHQDYSHRIMSAQEEERAWVARELHDDVLQRVALVRHELDSLWATLSACASPQEQHRLRALNAELVDLGAALRNVAHRLHPTIVDQLGLPKALQALAVEFERGGLEVAVSVPEHAALPPAIAHTAYRIAQEALRNVTKHAGVTEAILMLSVEPTRVILKVTDGGKGFDNGAARGMGLGLASMRERASLVRGEVAVRSRPGAGTTIEAILPLGAAA